LQHDPNVGKSLEVREARELEESAKVVLNATFTLKQTHEIEIQRKGTK